MNNLLNSILMVVVVSSLFLQSCAAVYRPVQPAMLPMQDYQWIGPDTCVEIDLMEHVLDGPRAKRYAKMERRNKVNLIAMKVRNYGNRDIHLPNDLELYTLNGDTISILVVEEALNALVETLTFDHSNSFVGVETDPSWIGDSWYVVNDLRKLQSHIRFAKNISEEYLKDCIVHPGQEITGFVVLPVEKGTPFQFSIR
jgi:hypothetical protein